MSPTLTTFLYEAANFLLLAGLLGWLFFKPVRKALAEQRERIEAAAKQAEQKLAEAEQVRAEAEARRRTLQDELDRLRASELEAARQKAEEIVGDARTAAARERETLARQSARLAESQAAKLSRAATTAAGEVVSRLLEQIRGPDLDAALLKAACEQLRSLPREKLAPIRVESARPLGDQQRGLLLEAVGKTVDMNVKPADREITWHVVEDLGPGVRIATQQGLIDATADGLAQFAERALLNQLNHRNGSAAPLE